MFSDIHGDGSNADKVRIQAMPIVHEFANLIKCDGQNKDMLKDFRAAETMVIREAVFCSMVATCQSLDLWPANANLAKDDMTYHDTTEPLEFIAQRLYNFVQSRSASGEEELYRKRMLAASFVVEFAHEHGIPSSPTDATAENMMMEFLMQVKIWGEKTKKKELTPCLQNLPAHLHAKAESWWKDNWKTAAIGAGIILAGAALLSAGVAIAAAAAEKNREDGNGGRRRGR